MAPKSTKGKGVAKDAGAAEPPESALAVQRTQSAIFPSTVDVFELRDSFRPLWGVKTGGGEFEAPGHARHPCRLRRPCPKSVPLLR